MEINTTATCPYCGHINKLRVTQVWEKHVFYCDIDSGGCDKLVVALTYATAEVKVGKVEMVDN